ncbi:scavenger receptor cysteine-rich domain-containing group B protein [Strongylocentrotus purpuratus]|uniref:SRCR domain-containing protein n=1 Tax=Strongylocentrotus purpuratus TaxID=7668 RepID=A0A7M7SUV9_STRPU|nr:scavenger receptor cysteine-rich domain-containing group B protein [Strongylocentrotus purpuratus]
MASPALGKLVWSGKLWMSCFFVLFFPNFIRCEGEVRLVDGPTANQGRVEIYHDGQWGTVCDDLWDDLDARVVCRQLGYSGNVGEARSGGTYGEGSDPVYLYYVACSGYESRLTDCGITSWGTYYCGHDEDAGVYCGDEIDGDIRLVDANGGLSSDEGRVEIFHDYQWGTVCDDSWDDIDASVVCRQLGYSGNVGVARSGGTYGQGSDPIYLDDVGCSGYESRLRYCSNPGWGNHDCGHYEDAGVFCGDEIDGDIRLVDANDGFSSYKGRVEIFHDFQWGTVCDDSWDDLDARVVCRQLGYSGNIGVARSGGTYGQGSDPIYLDDVGCLGHESRLTDCSNRGWGNTNCGHSEDAGISCGDDIEGEIRLVDGYSSDEGRVEIFHEGQWGTVCDDSWDDLDASVVCRQLGYSGNGGVARSGGIYGQGSDPIYLDNVGCAGSESRLIDCSKSEWGDHNCIHSEDAGVQCEDSPTQTPTQPAVKTSSRVVSVMASVGVCLSVLTMLSFIAVCWTCSTSKTAVTPRPSEPAIPLNTLSTHPAGTNIQTATASNGNSGVACQQTMRIYPHDANLNCMPLPNQPTH